MEEGHPGTREERKRANTHTLTLPPTHASMYVRANTAVASLHDPLAGFQVKDRIGRPAFRLSEVTKQYINKGGGGKKQKKLPHFPTYVVSENRNLAASARTTSKLTSKYCGRYRKGFSIKAAKHTAARPGESFVPTFNL